MPTATTSRRHWPSQCPEDETCVTCAHCYLATGDTEVCAGCCPHASETYPDDDPPADKGTLARQTPIVAQLKMSVALLRSAEAAMRYHYQCVPKLTPEWRELTEAQRNYWLNLARDAVVAYGVEHDEPLPVRGADLLMIFHERAEECLRYVAQGHAWGDERARLVETLQQTFADGQRDEAAARR